MCGYTNYNRINSAVDCCKIFFFQAEDGIRDVAVTGVQTCALPIYNEHVGAVAAIVFQHLEEALTRRFGLEWTARDDGHGFEIRGISGEMMRVFSSRRASITADLRGRAARFEEQYGRKPSQRELAHLAQASNFTTRNAKHGALDLAGLHKGWADKLARTLGVSLASVACLEAPEPAEVPRSLLRADGRSIYQRHGGTRYATHAQLTLEERMLALARASGAPRMDRAHAAAALGADLAQLDAALAGRAPDAPDARSVQDAQGARGARSRTGLREDQAAAALSVLTDGRHVSVINAPAGSGKTWILAAAGKAWAAAGLGRVIGITPSQSARNTLAAGVPACYNAAQFLGHLPGRRGARGPVRLRSGDLVLMDEASMTSTPDLADVITQAAAGGAKVILAGDTQQLQAVQNGGGMSLLAEALGYARPAEPAPFRARMEQPGSLRLRDGGTSVPAQDHQHAPILCR